MKKMMLVLVTVLLFSCSSKQEDKKDNFQNLEIELRSIIEQAYFEGQRNALNNDIRIKREGGKWIWTKSPWDDGLEPVFDPSN